MSYRHDLQLLVIALLVNLNCWAQSNPSDGAESTAVESAADAAPPAAATTPAAARPAAEALLLARLEKGQLQGEYHRLESPAGGFLAHYAQAETLPADGAMIVVLGYTELITSSAIVSAINQDFTPNRWSVLAVQLPLLADGANLEDYRELDQAASDRIDAAAAHLAAEGITKLIIFGHHAGAELAERVARESATSAAVIGLAAAGRWSANEQHAEQPLVEFVDDYDAFALKASEQRRLQAKRSGRAYRPVALSGVDLRQHQGAGELARRLRGWVTSLTGGRALAGLR